MKRRRGEILAGVECDGDWLGVHPTKHGGKVTRCQLNAASAMRQITIRKQAEGLKVLWYFKRNK